LKTSKTFVVHVSADQRFDLFADGEIIGKGPERGDRFNWFIHSYEIKLPKGKHTITARCWWIGDMAPFSQISIRGGFLLCAENEMHQVLSTGIATWRVAELDAYKFRRSTVLGGSATQAETTVSAENMPSNYRTGRGIKFVNASDNFKNAALVLEGYLGSWWKLTASTLPEMLNLPIKGMKVFHAEVLKKEFDNRQKMSIENHLNI